GALLYSRVAALPVRPSPTMGSAGLVGEDHLAGRRVLRLAGERLIRFDARCLSDLDVLSDPGGVEYCDRNCESDRDRVAKLDQRMYPRQRAFLLETAKKRLRSASILGRLAPHPCEAPTPTLDLLSL